MEGFAAVIAAGGTGSRFGSHGTPPKQFFQLRGRQIYVWSLIQFLLHDRIDRVAIVVPADAVGTVEADCRKLSIGTSAEARGDAMRRKITVVAGGASRQESVYLGLKSLDGEQKPEFVLIHDAARPFLTKELISGVIRQVVQTGACTAGLRTTDTISRITDNYVEETLTRDALLMVQTPQAGRYDWLMTAHEEAAQKGLATTDDASILSAAGHKVSVATGSPYNLKITQPSDLILAEAIADIVLKDRL